MIHVFIGTKAQLIKMAPVMAEMQKRGIEYNFIFSGQHQDTTDEIRANFGIKDPDIILYSGPDVTSIPKMLLWFIKVIFYTFKNKDKVWRGDKKGVVLNHGDTFSTLLGSILAKTSGLKNAHIESGLRSFKLFNPFPEELTRLIVFSLSDYYFAPGDWAIKNLEKYNGEKINTQVNTLYDALQHIKTTPPPTQLEIPNTQFGLVSFHRFENIFKEKQLAVIVDILIASAEKIKLLVIMHKPTQDRLLKTGLFNKLKDNVNIELRPRYDYQNFIHLLRQAEFVMTDGGSNQEECHYLGKPCILLRSYTERQEGLNSNTIISDFDTEVISNFIDNIDNYKIPELKLKHQPSARIVDALTFQT